MIWSQTPPDEIGYYWFIGPDKSAEIIECRIVLMPDGSTPKRYFRTGTYGWWDSTTMDPESWWMGPLPVPFR
jgi:hypothetical protein